MMEQEVRDMGFGHAHEKNEWRCIAKYAAVILPSVALGVLAMVCGGVSPVMWGQQIAAFVVFALLAGLLGRTLRRLPAAACAAVLVLVLGVTLFGAEAGGARRWLDLLVFNVNAAMLVIPALLMLLGGMERPYPALICAAAILALQPDASQLTAFAAAVLPVLWLRRKNVLWSAVTLLALAVCLLRAFSVPVVMEPVEYCEGILEMLRGISPLLMAAGVLALALVPAFWAVRFGRDRSILMLSLAIYYAAAMLFGLSGAYPMPIMGFGLSPIAGFYLTCLFVPLAERKEK